MSENIYLYDTEDIDLKESSKVTLQACKQFDDIIISFNIYNDSTPIDLTQYAVDLRVLRPDNTFVIQDTNITKNTSKITIECIRDITRVSGKAKCELRLVDSLSKQKTSFDFIIPIKPSVISENSIVSGNVVTATEELNKSIDIGNALDDALKEDITIGTQLDIDLDEDVRVGTILKNSLIDKISEGNALDDALETTTTNANNKKVELEGTISTANTSKTNLENATVIADAKKTELDTSIANAQDDINTINAVSNRPFTIPSTAWVGTEPNLSYVLSHNLGGVNLIVGVIDDDTKLSSMPDYKSIDGMKIELYSTTRRNITVTINKSAYSGNDSEWVSQEVIDARKGETSLKSKIDGVDTELCDMRLQYSSISLKNTRTKLKNKQPLKIVCHGDSMTWGYNTGPVQAVNNYPTVLQSKMRYIYEYSDITVINEGHSGQTSSYGLTNFTTQVLNRTPDLLIVMWGLNDSYNDNVPLVQFVDNIRQMILLAKINNIEVILATPVPIISRTLGLMYDLENKNYVEALKLLAIEQGIALCDIYEEFVTMFSNNSVGKDADYDSSGHLKDYSIVADFIMADKLCDIYSSKHSDGDIIRFDTNQVYNSVTASSSLSTGANFSEKYYVIDSNKPTEKIKIVLYVNAKIRLDIITWIYTTGGSINIKNFNNSLATFNSYSTTQNFNKAFGIELNKGLYCIELMGVNVESSKSFTVSSAVYNVIKPSSFLYFPVVLQNSWVVNGSGFADPIYVKEGNNVRLSGLIKNGVTTTDTVITNLPIGFRPSKDLVIPVISFENSTTYPGYLRIKSNGDIVCYVNIKNGFLPLEFNFPII